VCNGDLFTPLATKPDQGDGTLSSTRRAAFSSSNAANKLLPVPVIPTTGEAELVSSQSSASPICG